MWPRPHLGPRYVLRELGQVLTTGPQTSIHSKGPLTPTPLVGPSRPRLDLRLTRVRPDLRSRHLRPNPGPKYPRLGPRIQLPSTESRPGRTLPVTETQTTYHLRVPDRISYPDVPDRTVTRPDLRYRYLRLDYGLPYPRLDHDLDTPYWTKTLKDLWSRPDLGLIHSQPFQTPSETWPRPDYRA